MKKSLLLTVICAILFFSNSLAQDPYIPYLIKKSIGANAQLMKSGIQGSYPRHTEEFDWTEDWVLGRTIETSYTSFGEPAVIEYNQGGNRSMDIFSYNDQHFETEMIHKVMVDGSWVNQSRNVNNYNSQGDILESLSEEWTGTGWDLKEGTQITYQLDGNRISVMTSKSWNNATSTWDNEMRETYTYSGPSVYYTTVVSENWANEWVYFSKMELTWNGSSVTETLNYTYEGGDWVLAGKTSYEYRDNDSMVMTFYDPDVDGTWSASSRFSWTNDDHGNEILNQMEMFMGNWLVLSATRYQLSYSGNNVTQRITQVYSMFDPALKGVATGVDWKNVKKEVFSNFASLSTDVTLMPEKGISVFPNPAEKQVVVRLALVQAGNVNLKVISITGQVVLDENITANGSDVNYLLDLRDLQRGSYFLIAHDKQGKEIGTTRLIKQ